MMMKDLKPARRRARENVENDPTARQRYEEMIAIARELTGEEGEERDVAIAAIDLVFDLHPQPVKLYEGDPLLPRNDGRPHVMYATISFPVATDDMSLRREYLQFVYAMRETLAWLRGGITPVELADMGMRDAWDVISGWVDKQRGVS